MKKGSIRKLLLLILALSFTLFAKSIAVIELSTIFEKDRRISSNATGFIRHLIQQDNSYTVLSKNNTSSILENQSFQYSKDCSDISCDVKKGTLLEVDFLITGAINSIDNNYFLVLKLIDMTKEELVGMVSSDIPKSTVSEMKKIINELVSALFYDQQNDNKPITRILSPRKLNLLELSSKPDSVNVYINGMNVGVTPYLNDRILSGEYYVELNKKNYMSIRDTIKLSENDKFKKNYKFDFSDEYKDSLRHEFFTKKGGRNSRRIAFGTVAVLTAGAGFLFEYLANSESDNAAQSIEEYSLATGNFEVYKDNYEKAERAFDKNTKYRNIFCGISGGMLLGFIISIPF